MKRLTIAEANVYLSHIGMKIGDWNQITDAALCEQSKPNWINFQAPKNSLELFNFAQHVAGWLPKGDWKIFQIDNSTSLNRDEAFLFGRLLFGLEDVPSLIDNRTFLFEFGNNEERNRNTELLISNLIFVFLLFECHGYVVSSNSSAGQCLSIQDGFVYFSSRDKGISEAEILLKDFEKSPLASPQWISKMVADERSKNS